MRDQPAPQPGRQKVAYRAWLEFWTALRHQYRKGLERYKTPLMTHNGRDAGQDAMQELADAVMYVQQLRMENEDCKAESKQLQAEILMLKMRLDLVELANQHQGGDAQT